MKKVVNIQAIEMRKRTMIQSKLSYFMQMGAVNTMGTEPRIDKESLQISSFSKAPILHELGRFMRSAYDQGVTLEEAYAICGAAYGDWREAQEFRTEGILEEEVFRPQQ